MRGPLARPAYVVLAGCGVALAALGQAQTSRPVSGKLSWLAPHAHQVTDVYPEPKSVVTGMALLVAGAIVFAIAVWRWRSRDEEAADLDPPGRGFGLQLPADALPLVAFGVGVIPLLVLLVRLYQGDYSHWLIAVFVVALALFAVPFAARDLRPLSRPRWRWHWGYALEAAFVAAMMALYYSTNLRDLTHWRFSAEGDEYAFYVAAKNIAKGLPFNIFSQEGVYNAHPVFSSAYQAIFVKLFGGDLFAWKLSLVTLIAVTLIPFYLAVRELFSWRPAVFATAMMASSHYLMAYTHTGFNSLDPLFPTTLAMWLLVVGMRRDSSLALYASGWAAGLGFYTYFSARATIVMIAFVLLSQGRRGLQPQKVLPIAVAFAVTVAPIFTLHGWDVIDVMLDYGAAESPESSGVTRFAHNIVPSLMAFNYNSRAARYASGSLLDPLSAVLFVLGVGLAVSKIRRPSFRTLVIWWFVAIGVSGFAYSRVEVAAPRLHYALPAAAALAGVALDWAILPIAGAWRRPAVRAAVPVVALAMLLPPVLFLNLHRFWYETPRHDGLIPESVVVRAVLSEECDALPPPAIVTPYPDGLLVGIFTAYDLEDRSPTMVGFENVLNDVPGEVTDGSWGGCIVIDAQAEKPLLDDLLSRIGRLYPDKRQHLLYDLSHGARAYVFY